MSSTSKNASETNANQGALAQQQTATDQQIISNQQTTNNTIAADIGNLTPNVPNPPGLPSVSAVIGPGESDVIQAANINNAVTSAGEAAMAVDPNETGLIATFLQSAQGFDGTISQQVGDGTSAQGIANPLGPQVTYVDSAPGGGAPASTTSTLNPLVLIGFGVVGLVVFIVYRNEHHHKAA